MKTKFFIFTILTIIFCIFSAGCMGLSFDNDTKQKLTALEIKAQEATERALSAEKEYKKIMATLKIAKEKRESGELKADDYAVVFNELMESAGVFKETASKAWKDAAEIAKEQNILTDEKGVPLWYTLMTIGTGIIGGLGMAFPQLRVVHAGLKAAQGAVGLLTRAIGTGDTSAEIKEIVKKARNPVVENILNGSG